MPKRFKNDLSYHLRTVAGYLIIAGGIAGGIWSAWWLSFRGDIVEILHRLKLGLPSWGWLVLKYGLSLAFGLFFLGVLLGVGFLVLRAPRRA